MPSPHGPAPPADVLSETSALCPSCLRVLPAQLVERDGKVWLARACPWHGEAVTLVLSDAAWWRWSRQFVQAGRQPSHTATETAHGCPYDCGLCPEHAQHACVSVLEITQGCNLACPACFAGSPHAGHATVDDVGAMVEAVLRAEGGEADVVMLSGGEPTVHPRFLEIVDVVQQHPVRYTIVNSNGMRFAREPALAEEMAKRGCLVYLQFDGFSPATYRTLRGEESLPELKLQALHHLAEAGVRVVLVATLLGGANDHEIGDIVRFGAEHPAVRAVSLQPQFAEGRYVGFDPADRLTLTDVIDRIHRDSGVFTRDDFVPIPCCDPVCTAASYAYVRDGTVTPVTQLVPVQDYLAYLENTSMPNLSEAFKADAEEMREVLTRLYSKSAPSGSAEQAEALRCACEPLLDEIDHIDDLPEHVFAVTIEGFMDRFVFDVDRVKRCCIQQALPDGRVVPFCAYNTLYRFAPDQRPRPPEEGWSLGTPPEHPAGEAGTS